MNSDAPAPIAFGDILIDRSGRRLLRGGQVQALEPKAYAVLALLAESPGRVYARDEILDAVWGHRHVTPGVLNRVMTLLRHALGEDAQSPRYLHTVHGYGYRFDLPEGADTPADPAPMADPPLRRENHPTPARSGVRRQWLMAALAALVLAAGALAWWRYGGSATTPRVADPALRSEAMPVLAVLPLRALGEDRRSQDFADGLSEELIGLLARIDGLRVTSHTSTVQFRDTRLPLAEVARRLRATHVLEGSVRQDGERLRISLRLVEAASDRTLWTQDLDREFRDIFVIQRNIAYAIGNAMQRQLSQPPPSPPADEDPALYQRYLIARNASPGGLRNTNAASLPSETALRALLREHPDYARAWGALAAKLWLRSLATEPGREALRSEAEQMAATALRLDPQQPDALAVMANRACRQQRWQDCLSLSQRSIALTRSEVGWRGAHAQRLATMGYVDQALREIDDTLLIAPYEPSLHFWRGRLLDTLGRHEEAQSHLAMADPVMAQTARYFNAVWRRDYATAARVAESLPSDLPWRGSEIAAAAALRDPALWPAVQPAIDYAERNPRYGQVHYDFTRLLLPVRDYPRDIAGLDAVQREGYASYQWVLWQPESRELRQNPAFAQYLQRSGLLAFWREHGWPRLCRAEGREGVVCD
ncbi:winged helix-turn-helix domain-containing protein [Lysobacter silvisoli]|uniref:OmpR/PhoB-type domain-containing protein n=1 Tax=Lysobacter silvisoli TaxID=2293254 RepID=A0A371JY12_9GAMM|nr:winged helix-turn-helix domain-containing protein [Lysobacter silvisoli]RDZ26546.1 hypothetical protein DX914_16290 [Lysobacter silvisoli]